MRVLRLWLLRPPLRRFGRDRGLVGRGRDGFVVADQGDDRGRRDGGGRRSRRRGLLLAPGHPSPPARGQCPAGEGREVAGRGRAREEREDDAGQAEVDVHQLGVNLAAVRALVEVPVDGGGVALAQPAPHVGAEQGERRAAALRWSLAGEVHLQVLLAQALAGAVGEGGDVVGGLAEDGGGLRGLDALDLRVPEHRLPLGAQREEGAGDQRPFQPLQGGVDEWLAAVELLHVVGDDLALLAAGAVVDGVPDRGEQVGTERVGRSAAPLDDAEDAGERLGDDVVDLGLTVHQLAGEAARRVDVPLVERGVCGGISATDLFEKLGVTDE
ncbi:hypothetical protein NORO109296_09680 [Nocardiopsis rhodophaea]